MPTPIDRGFASCTRVRCPARGHLIRNSPSVRGKLVCPRCSSDQTQLCPTSRRQLLKGLFTGTVVALSTAQVGAVETLMGDMPPQGEAPSPGNPTAGGSPSSETGTESPTFSPNPPERTVDLDRSGPEPSATQSQEAQTYGSSSSTSTIVSGQEGPGAPPPTNGDQPSPSGVTAVPKSPYTLTEEAAKKLLDEEEERRKQRKKRRGRIRELEEIRSELAEKEIILLEKEAELLEKEQTLMVLKEELELERKLRALLTKEKEKAEEEAALSMGLCTGGAILP